MIWALGVTVPHDAVSDEIHGFSQRLVHGAAGVYHVMKKLKIVTI